MQGLDADDSVLKDQASHFVLRLAYCRTEELRRWFLAQESELFRARFSAATLKDQVRLAISTHQCLSCCSKATDCSIPILQPYQQHPKEPFAELERLYTLDCQARASRISTEQQLAGSVAALQHACYTCMRTSCRHTHAHTHFCTHIACQLPNQRHISQPSCHLGNAVCWLSASL